MYELSYVYFLQSKKQNIINKQLKKVQIKTKKIQHVTEVTYKAELKENAFNNN